jgi:hypothetical protein
VEKLYLLSHTQIKIKIFAQEAKIFYTKYFVKILDKFIDGNMGELR